MGEALPPYDMAAVQSENTIRVGALLLGKYKVVRELGRGGMAAVYEAEHVHIGKRLAVKVLASELASSAIVIERFFREARAAAAVQSPYIVDVHDSGRLEDGRPFIAMELLVGESLYDRMARVRLIDPRTTVRIVTQVAKGLMKAHAAGIVHRDLKPENIHLCAGEDGEEIAKILDFGLAKFYSPVQTDEKTARLTREGAVFGTPAYMSPEQVKGRGTVDHRADLWALGCMTFECLTGRPVWNTEQGVAMTFAAIAAAPLPTPSRIRPELSLEFDMWFEKALERDPDRRYQSAIELAESLAKALGAQPPPSLISLGTPSRHELDALAAARASESVGYPDSGRNPVTRVAGGSPRSLSVPLDAVVAGEPSIEEFSDASRAAETEMPPRRAVRSRGRWLLWSFVVLALAGSAGFIARRYKLLSRLRPTTVRSATSYVVVGSASPSSASIPMASAAEMPSWLSVTEEGQQLLSAGDADGALRKFRDAVDAGAGPFGKSFLDQVKLGSTIQGPCKMVAFSHPRVGYAGSAGRPTLAVTSLGAIVAWTDDHEQPGHDHVYSVLVDSSGRPASRPRDLTPEADYVVRPALLSSGDRVVLLYWDKNARDPGVRVRWLESDGRIGMMSEVIAAAKPGLTWPAPVIDAAEGGGFWVAWQQDTDKDGEDLYVRHLGRDLKPSGVEVRLTDFETEKGHVPRVSSPSLAASLDSVFVAYGIERDHQHVIERMRIPASSDSDAGQAGGSRAGKAAHGAGDVSVVNESKVSGDYPAITCVSAGCFVVWHELDKGGVQAAFLDPVGGSLLWRKRFAPHGGHPAIASSPAGAAEVAYYEAGRVRLASVSRDGVGAPSSLARVSGDPPRPWIASGRTSGEWYVAWLDVEAGHTEPFVLRVQCHD